MTKKEQVGVVVLIVVFVSGLLVPEEMDLPNSQDGLRVPEGFRAKKGTMPEDYTRTEWAKEVIHEKTGIEMIFIPAGEFVMGSAVSAQKIAEEYEGKPEWFGSEHPQHRVGITRPFYMGRHEVTVGQWYRLMGTNPNCFKGNDALPVECVPWNDFQKFLSKAGDGLTLPTEAQWEYACRAGTVTRYSFGDDKTELGDYAWYIRNSANVTHPIGQKKPNVWGLYDMHGNVWELCADWFGGEYYSTSPAEDPEGPSSGEYKVRRGGAFDAHEIFVRSATRLGVTPDHGSNHLGFRVIKSLE